MEEERGVGRTEGGGGGGERGGKDRGWWCRR